MKNMGTTSQQGKQCQSEYLARRWGVGVWPQLLKKHDCISGVVCAVGVELKVYFCSFISK